jgi:hypothetical protein
LRYDKWASVFVAVKNVIVKNAVVVRSNSKTINTTLDSIENNSLVRIKGGMDTFVKILIYYMNNCA